MEGWIKMHRKLLESEIWIKKPSSWLKIWQYIILSVNHKDNKFYKKGTNFFNWTELVKNRSLGRDITINNVEHCVKFLKSAEQIAAQKTTRGVVITVLNYSKYNPEAEIAAEEKRNRSGTINKNDKNVKNIDTNKLVSNTSKKDPDVDYILEVFEKTIGHKPTDRSPRNMAHTLKRQILRLIKDLSPYVSMEFKDTVNKSFAWYDTQNELKARSLNTVRRNITNILFENTRKKYIKEVKTNDK